MDAYVALIKGQGVKSITLDMLTDQDVKHI